MTTYMPAVGPTGLSESGHGSPNHRSVAPAGCLRQSSVRSDGSQKKRSSFRITAKKALRAVANRVKKVFRVSSKRPKSTFVMPSEFAAMKRSNSSRSSQRSRRQPVRMTSAISVNDVQQCAAGNRNSNMSSGNPSIILTSASVRGRTSQYVIHSIGGPDLPPRSPAMKKFVRTSHPAVSYVIEGPATPAMTATDSMLDESDDSDWSTIDSKDANLCIGTPEPSPTAADFAGQVQPNLIIRRSGVSLEADSSAVASLINKIDGVRLSVQKSDLDSLPSQLRLSPSSDISLPFIAKLAALSVDCEAEQPQAVAGAPAEEHRKNALAALEGAPASVPAKAASPERVPSILQATRPVVLRKPLSHKKHLTTGDVATLGNMKQIYLPYSGAFNPYDEPVPVASAKKLGKQPADKKVQAALEEATAGSSSRDSIPDFAGTNSHKLHYERIESGIIDGDCIPVFADDAEHRAHYTRVESGVFDNEPAVPSSASPSGKQHKPAQIKRKAVSKSSSKPTVVINYNKPLPATPALGSPRRLTPQVIAMNDSGFPIVAASSSAFHAQPKYQRRSVNDVEAKFKREQAKKVAKKQVVAAKVAREQEVAVQRLLLG